MSEQWGLFPCQIGEHQAFIAYDHGLRDEIDGLAPQSLLKLKATIADPNDHGLPKNREFGNLAKLEDDLNASITELGGILVGRVTVASLRIFYYYVDISEAQADELVARHAESSGYEIRYTLREDAGREGYWQDLFPSRRDLQVANDLRVIEALESNGDSLDTARQIDHWAYFCDAGQMNSYVAWLKDKGFDIQSAKTVNPQDAADPERPYRVVFFHHLAPTLQNITNVTVELADKAVELGGEYDGWETQIVETA